MGIGTSQSFPLTDAQCELLRFAGYSGLDEGYGVSGKLRVDA